MHMIAIGIYDSPKRVKKEANAFNMGVRKATKKSIIGFCKASRDSIIDFSFFFIIARILIGYKNNVKK